MPSEYSKKPGAKRKAPTFKPPRPAAKKKADIPRRKSAPAKALSISSDQSDEISLPSEDGENPQAATPSQSDEPPPTIPPKLLTRLLHHYFEDEETRLGKDANTLVGKYIETFVREAIARATFERAQAQDGSIGAEFLEVGAPYTAYTLWGPDIQLPYRSRI